jgi:hypothetical protein
VLKLIEEVNSMKKLMLIIAMIIPMIAMAGSVKEWERCVDKSYETHVADPMGEPDLFDTLMIYKKVCGSKPAPKNFTSTQMEILNRECAPGKTYSVCKGYYCGPFGETANLKVLLTRSKAFNGFNADGTRKFDTFLMNFGMHDDSFIKKASRKCAEINRGR